MRKLLAMLTAGALAAFIGCDNGTSGGPGATKRNDNGIRDKSAAVLQPEDTFSLAPPQAGHVH